MQVRRQITKSGISWRFSEILRLALICLINLCIFASTSKLDLTTELVQSLLQNPVNPGIGVNYYGKIQNTTRKKFGHGLTLEDIKRDFQPRDCSKAPKNSSCIQRGTLFQDPDFLYTLLHREPCDLTSKYRKYDGTCLNPLLPVLGMADDCYFRFTPPYYEGYGDLRKSSSGNPLPEPRDISLKIFQDHHRPEANLSFQFLTFGQLIAHDVSRAVQPQTNCCAPENAKKKECKPISVRPDDPFYSQFNKTCIDFQRSDKCMFDNSLNREQKNGATAALDCSIIYGTDEDKLNKLRTLDGTGMLKTIDSGKPGHSCLMPKGKDPEDIFCPKSQESECFLSGDPRVNQHASLTSLHTVFVTEHNRIAKEFKKINPRWKEEKLFQEARKLLIAEFQCISYQDFLPLLITPRIMHEFDMTIQGGTAGTFFLPISVIAVWHEFAHAAFRLHNMVPTDIGALHLRFRDTFSNPDLLWKGHITQIINGSQYVPVEKMDRYMIEDLTNYLYQEPESHFGKDLAATNIQRGRDHGMAPYVNVVKFCTEFTINITTFDDLIKLGLMPEEYVHLLKELYETVEDVDMWVGMQLENPMEGTFIGPSAVCIIAKQLFFTQKGDRLFFSHTGVVPQFSSEQRSAIKNVTLGRILCDNLKLTQVPNNTFLLPGPDNPMVSCDDLPRIDLSHWKSYSFIDDLF